MKLVFQSLYHVVLVTLGQKKFLTRVNQDILYNYMQSVVYNKLSEPVKIHGNGEHVHIAVKLSPEVALGHLVKELQQNTIDFLRREKSTFPEFPGWDSGYFAVSYHPEQEHELEEVISNQYNYHRKTSFEEEMEVLFQFSKNLDG